MVYVIYMDNIFQKNWCITFGAGGENFVNARERLVQQAQVMGIFHEIYGFGDKELKRDTDFWSKHGDFVTANPRGYGYWLWKPYLILKTMSQMRDGDTLLYLDCGCELDPRKRAQMMECLNLVQQDWIMATIWDELCCDVSWCKMDLVEHLDARNTACLCTPQKQAGMILFVCNDITRDFVRSWYEIACQYSFLDDTPSISPNLNYFYEHRHDQSIFSLLAKKRGLCANVTLDRAVDYARNKTGISKLSNS
jgi:hypothetical protein